MTIFGQPDQVVHEAMLCVRSMPVFECHTKTVCHRLRSIPSLKAGVLCANKFKSAVESDKLKIDIRIGVYRSGKNKGKYHDHGTGFRINKRDFLLLFDNFTQII